jgi:hypothetical protein
MSFAAEPDSLSNCRCPGQGKGCRDFLSINIWPEPGHDGQNKQHNSHHGLDQIVLPHGIRAMGTFHD